jgi:hypothetical protein
MHLMHSSNAVVQRATAALSIQYKDKGLAYDRTRPLTGQLTLTSQTF